MDPKYSKYIAFAIMLVVLIAVWAGANKLKYDKWPWQMLKEANDNYKKANFEEVNDLVVEVPEAQNDPEEAARRAAMEDISAKIGQLSPKEPVLGGKWFVARFWFAADNEVYAEYEDGHIMGRILVEVTGSPEYPAYKVLAYFEPGEDDWELKQGEDTAFGKQLDLYEFDETKGEWVKKN